MIRVIGPVFYTVEQINNLVEYAKHGIPMPEHFVSKTDYDALQSRLDIAVSALENITARPQLPDWLTNISGEALASLRSRIEFGSGE